MEKGKWIPASSRCTGENRARAKRLKPAGATAVSTPSASARAQVKDVVEPPSTTPRRATLRPQRVVGVDDEVPFIAPRPRVAHTDDPGLTGGNRSRQRDHLEGGGDNGVEDAQVGTAAVADADADLPSGQQCRSQNGGGRLRRGVTGDLEDERAASPEGAVPQACNELDEQGSRAVHREAQGQVEAVLFEGYAHGLQLDALAGQIEAGADDALVENPARQCHGAAGDQLGEQRRVEQKAVEEAYRQLHRASGRQYDEGTEDPPEFKSVGAAGEQHDLVGVGLGLGEDEGALDATGQVLDEEIEFGLAAMDWAEAEQRFLPGGVEQITGERHLLARVHQGRYGSVEAQALEMVHGDGLRGRGHWRRDTDEKT
jgi:hypothetical protein